MLQKLRSDLKQAMKEKNVAKKLVIQGIISACDEARIKLKHELNDQEVVDVIRKEKTAYLETFEAAKKRNDLDMMADLFAKAGVANSYLPAQISIEEVAVQAVILVKEKNLDTTNKGLLMKVLMPELKKITDGKTASDVINSLITK